jgi:hypothetical protein
MPETNTDTVPVGAEERKRTIRFEEVEGLIYVTYARQCDPAQLDYDFLCEKKPFLSEFLEALRERGVVDDCYRCLVEGFRLRPPRPDGRFLGVPAVEWRAQYISPKEDRKPAKDSDCKIVGRRTTRTPLPDGL